MAWVITDGKGGFYCHDLSVETDNARDQFDSKGVAFGVLEGLVKQGNAWDDWFIQEVKPTDGSTGLDNPAYNIPKGATTIYHVVKQSNMSDDVGECFRLLYAYTTSGTYKLPGDVPDITALALKINMGAFVYNAMQGLYRSGHGERNSLKRDMEKAQYYIHHEWSRLEQEGKYSELLEEAYTLIDGVVGKPYHVH